MAFDDLTCSQRPSVDQSLRISADRHDFESIRSAAATKVTSRPPQLVVYWLKRMPALAANGDKGDQKTRHTAQLNRTVRSPASARRWTRVGFKKLKPPSREHRSAEGPGQVTLALVNTAVNVGHCHWSFFSSARHTPVRAERLPPHCWRSIMLKMQMKTDDMSIAAVDRRLAHGFIKKCSLVWAFFYPIQATWLAS